MARALGAVERVRDAVAESGAADCQECLLVSAGGLAGILLDLAETLRHCPTWPDRSAMREALRARNAAIEGDAALVDTFAGSWLGLARPVAWRAAVEMALLGEWVHVLGGGVADTPTLVGLLRQDVQAEHRLQQPLWERRIGGQRTALLSGAVGEGLILSDLLVGAASPEDVVLAAELLDPRIVAVLRQLRAPEEVVARLWACTGDAWAHAAADAGLPPSYGERVRRKLKRLGRRHTDRSAAAAVRLGEHPCR
ncbi:hypothetical protein [Streptomyces sp. NPDC059009]|uniref:hypothetical protein n=1 Tax=Streptomyces sp. NPDC059009 TaxID=3346694 RepID=UPI0036C65DB7